MARKKIFWFAALVTIVMGILSFLTAIGVLPVKLSNLFPSNHVDLKTKNSKSSFGPKWIEKGKVVLILNDRCTLTYEIYENGRESSTDTGSPSGTFAIKSSEGVQMLLDNAFIASSPSNEIRVSLTPGDTRKFSLSNEGFSIWLLELDSKQANVWVKKDDK